MRMESRVLIVCMLPLILTGCWDRVEIEERGTVLAIAIDPASEEDMKEEPLVSHPEGAVPESSNKRRYKVTVQLAIPGQIPLGPESAGSGGNSSSERVWVVSAVGHTMDDALQNLQQKIANELYYGHLQVVILNQDIAREGITDINEYLRRIPEIRRTVWMVVNHKDAAETMSVAPKLERVPALYFAQTFRQAAKMGKMPESLLGQFWIDSAKQGKEGFLPYISVKKQENIEVSGIAYFKGDKLAGILKTYEVAFYNGLTGHNPGGATAYISVPGTDGEMVMFQSTRRTTRYKLSFRDGKPHFDVYITVKGIIKEKSDTVVDLENPRDIKKLEESAEEDYRKMYEKLLQKTQSEGSDIFGFGDRLRAYSPKYWDAKIRSKEDWQEEYERLSIEVHPTVEIELVGLSTK